MSHLVCKANYDDEFRGEEFTPTHFIMEIDEPILCYLKKEIESVKNFNRENKDLLKIEFHFGFGLWTEFNELLSDNFEEEVTVTSKIDELFAEDDLIEQQYLETHRIEIYHDGDFRFSCYGKYDGQKIYTCLLSLEELEREIK